MASHQTITSGFGGTKTTEMWGTSQEDHKEDL